MLFQSAVHFKGDANNLLCLLLDPGTDGIGLLGEFEAEFEVLLFEEKDDFELKTKTKLSETLRADYLKYFRFDLKVSDLQKE